LHALSAIATNFEETVDESANANSAMVRNSMGEACWPVVLISAAEYR
jgi:hypothetical protein